jgi:hypothetical protein
MKSLVNMPKEWRLEPIGSTGLASSCGGLALFMLVQTWSAIDAGSRPWTIALWAGAVGAFAALGLTTWRDARRELSEHRHNLAEITTLRQQLAAYEHRYGVLREDAAA